MDMVPRFRFTGVSAVHGSLEPVDRSTGNRANARLIWPVEDPVDLAIFSGAITLWSLVQGAVLLLRWRRFPESRDLFWSGLGGVAIGVGSALYGSRYFGWPYAVYATAANPTIVTGLAFLVQGIRSADGFKPNLLLLVSPAVIWLAASCFAAFRATPLVAVWLFAIIGFVWSAIAVRQLTSGGLQLPGRRLWAVLWIFILATMVVRLVGAVAMLPSLSDRYAGTAWPVVFLAMAAIAMMAVGYVNLTLSDGLPRTGAITAALERGLAGRAFPSTGDDGLLWSLRIDRLLSGNAPATFQNADINDLQQAIVRACPPVVEVLPSGPDRVIWRTTPDEQGHARSLRQLIDRMTAIVQRPGFPRVTMSCGVTTFDGDNPTAAALVADRSALTVSNHGK